MCATNRRTQMFDDGPSPPYKNAKLLKGEGKQHLFFHCGYVSTTADSLSRRIEVAAEGGRKGSDQANYISEGETMGCI